MFINKLKTILQSNKFYYFLFIFFCLFFILNKLIPHQSLYSSQDNTFDLVITDYNFDGNKLSLDLKGIENLKGTYYIKNKQELTQLQETIKYGLKVNITGQLKENHPNTTPYTFNYQKYLNNNNIYYTLEITNIQIIKKAHILYQIKNYLAHRCSQIDKEGYMQAFILGNKDTLNKEIYTNYQKIGITHLFALSGMHIGLLSSIILKLLKKFNNIIKYIITIIILTIYSLIVGMPYSIVRCLIFLIITYIDKIFNLKITSFKRLLLTASLIIFINYKAIYDIGFLYSFLTVGGLILSQNFIHSHNKLIAAFKLSLIAFLFSIPITLHNFYEINLLSILYNIVYIPLISLIIYPLCLLSFILPFLYPIFNLFINFLQKSSTILANIKLFNLCLSFNNIEILIYYFCLILALKKGKYYLLVSSLIIIIIDILIPHFDPNAYIYYLDVSQGDSSLIITPYQKEIILIDTGGLIKYNQEEWAQSKNEYYVSDNTITLLKALGIQKINYLILTHGDYDHMGDALHLITKIQVINVIFNNDKYNDLETSLISQLNTLHIKYYQNIDKLSLKHNQLLFLNTRLYNDENNNSNVLYTNIYNKQFLFMGDASKEKEIDLINKYNLKDITFLKVGHHGSNSSSTKEFIKQLNPQYSFISVGQNNKYGHPHPEVLTNLINSTIYRTDLNGTILVKINSHNYQITNWSP